MPWTDSLTSRQDIRRRRPISSNQSFIPLPYYEATACGCPCSHQRDYLIPPTLFGDNPSLQGHNLQPRKTWGSIRFITVHTHLLLLANHRHQRLGRSRLYVDPRDATRSLGAIGHFLAFAAMPPLPFYESGIVTATSKFSAAL